MFCCAPSGPLGETSIFFVLFFFVFSCNSIEEVCSITIKSSIEILERKTLRYLN